MDVIKELEIFNKEIQIAKNVVKELECRRIDWCRSNRKEIKHLYPVKGKIYEIIDIKNALKHGYYAENLDTDVYFFKANNVRFTPHLDFNTSYGTEKPTVSGVLLDCNLNQFHRDSTVYITNLKEINDLKTPQKLGFNFTKVYVMIDKNTGYYKIGRSINPEKREKTLQSEKPTIEMLFNHDARVKDEKELHDMFRDKRVRGEWFDLNGSDLNKIKEYFHCDPITEYTPQ